MCVHVCVKFHPRQSGHRTKTKVGTVALVPSSLDSTSSVYILSVRTLCVCVQHICVCVCIGVYVSVSVCV